MHQRLKTIWSRFQRREDQSFTDFFQIFVNNFLTMERLPQKAFVLDETAIFLVSNCCICGLFKRKRGVFLGLPLNCLQYAWIYQNLNFDRNTGFRFLSHSKLVSYY